MSTLEIYNHTIRSLPTAERLRLATLILNDIEPQSIVDYSDEWSDKDLKDFSNATWRRVESHIEETPNA